MTRKEPYSWKAGRALCYVLSESHAVTLEEHIKASKITLYIKKNKGMKMYAICSFADEQHSDPNCTQMWSTADKKTYGGRREGLLRATAIGTTLLLMAAADAQCWGNVLIT